MIEVRDDVGEVEEHLSAGVHAALELELELNESIDEKRTETHRSYQRHRVSLDGLERATNFVVFVSEECSGLPRYRG